MLICFFERNRQMGISCYFFPSTSSHRLRGKVDQTGRSAGRKTSNATQISGGSSQRRAYSKGPLALGPSPRAGLSFWAAFPSRSPGVSWSNEIFSGEGWGAPVSGGIDCSDAALRLTLSPSEMQFSHRRLSFYLSAVRIKRENDCWREGVNMAEPPSDSRHAHPADKVEPRTCEEAGKCTL